VLWLLEGPPAATRNLRREAASRGVAPERLVFALRLPLETHLARQRLAGLFLDTLPYRSAPMRPRRSSAQPDGLSAVRHGPVLPARRERLSHDV
jgi:hypothetical protein